MIFNWVDLVFVGLTLFFILTTRGFLSTFLEVIGFIISLFLSYRFYWIFGAFVHSHFNISQGFANVIGFFLVWFLSEVILFITIYYMAHKYLGAIHNHPWNRYLGFIAAIMQAFMIFLFFISLIFALPVKGDIKNDILHSYSGPFFVRLSTSLQTSSKNVFGGAVSDALNFLTIKPESNESVDLGFKLTEDQMSIDHQSELIMIEQVNKERTSRGLQALEPDDQLTELAREYARTMLLNGFFSHISLVDGTSPGDRATNHGINYQVLGENLAFAPDVYLAHQGLMNSPGHRANILSPDYNHVGIGVIDGGVYGRMFVQEFEN
jgi:uncharacterized protein YkwD